MPVNYQSCDKLRTIPKSKILYYKNKITSDCSTCNTKTSGYCNKCNLKLKLLDRYIEANIPIDYWFKSAEDFKGDANLLSIYKTIENDIEAFYIKGKHYFLKGTNGVGKTYWSTMLLKRAAEKGYSSLYCTLFDIVNVVVHSSMTDKFEANRELKMCDFLVIDEFDPRFFGTGNAAELYGRVLESIIRIRFSNKLPTVLITNNLDPVKSLGDDLSVSIGSLVNLMEEIPVIGQDYRRVLKGINV
jgi:DNA replication protein DnaC